MIYIRKGHEPESLTKYRKSRFAYFDGYTKKDDIREYLLKEQGYLCAYCMRRIDKEHMKIEHWYPEDRLNDVERLDFRNMLGACLGHITGTKGADDTCDTHKGNMLIKVNPQDSLHIKEIQYRSATGEIYSKDKQIQIDLTETLNLNSGKHLLMENRKAALDAVLSTMKNLQRKGNWNTKLLKLVRDLYEKVDESGKKKEYAGIVLWYLDRKLKQTSNLH